MSNTQSICTRCGSPREEIETIVRQSANPLYPITMVKYRCTNEECQKESERQQAALLKQKEERAEKSRQNQLDRKAKVGA